MRMTVTSSGTTYSIMSSTGNVLAENTGTLKRYDPFGVAINNSNTYGFGGSQLRETESRFSIDFIQMGARVYIPSIGRFLQVDPIEGGTQNDYVYPVDPINAQDFSGKLVIAIPVIIGYAVIGIAIGAIVGIGSQNGTWDRVGNTINNAINSINKLLAQGNINKGGQVTGDTNKVNNSSSNPDSNNGKSLLPLIPAAVKPLVTDGKLQHYVNDFYKGVNNMNRVGNGTTSDAIRYELRTGLPVGNRFHSIKGEGLINGLTKWLRQNPDALPEDIGIARNILDDLVDAFKTQK